MNNIKLSPHAIGRVMPGIHTKPIPLTAKQEQTLAEMREKNSQSKVRFELERKLVEIPESNLSAGAKTYVQEVWNEHHYSFRKQFSNKYTRKGHELEGRSISVLMEYLDTFGVKNDEYLENDYIGGTPDVRLDNPKVTIDVKNVYFPDGLNIHTPEVEDTNYIWQMHAYNWLDGKEKGYIARILMNPPEEQLRGQIWDHWRASEGVGEPTEDFSAEVEQMYDFENRVPLNDRIRLFEVNTTEDDIKAMIKAVELFREEYDRLTQQFESRSKIKI